MLSMRKKLRRVSLLMLVISLLSACNSDPELSEEDKVKATLNAIETAAQERSLSGMVEHLSPSYRDFDGNDYKAVKDLLRLQLLRNQSINIFSKIRELEVIGNSATAELSVAMASRGVDLSSEANRLRADTHRFSIRLAKEKELWKIKSVSWQRGW